MKSMVDLSHEFLKPVLHKQAICVDATLGQGKDTDFFLSQNVHKVYGFEIQRDVFESTKERLDDQRTCFYNVGHEHMKEYIHEEVDAILFNFGYFPKGDLKITTQSSSSVSAVRQALNLLKVKGRMALVMYPHDTGKEEAICVEEFLKTQTSVYKGYKQDKIEMRGDRAEMSDFPLYLNTVAGGLDRRDQTIGGFSFVVKIYAVPVVEIIG